MIRTLVGCLLSCAAACANPGASGDATPTDRDLEFIEEPITVLDELGGGIAERGGPKER